MIESLEKIQKYNFLVLNWNKNLSYLSLETIEGQIDFRWDTFINLSKNQLYGIWNIYKLVIIDFTWHET